MFASPRRSDLTIRLLAHPARAHLLPRLTERLGRPAEVIWNDESPWAGMKDVLQREVGTPHLLVMQDDSLPCENFLNAVRGVLNSEPDRLIALFHAGQPRPTANDIRRAQPGSFVELRYVRGSDWTPTVALAWPRHLVAAFRAWRWTGSQNQRGDDLPLGQFARAHGGALACVPSIVQHPDDVDSLWVKKRARHGRDPLRVAVRWSEDGSPWAT